MSPTCLYTYWNDSWFCYVAFPAGEFSGAVFYGAIPSFSWFAHRKHFDIVKLEYRTYDAYRYVTVWRNEAFAREYSHVQVGEFTLSSLKRTCLLHFLHDVVQRYGSEAGDNAYLLRVRVVARTPTFEDWSAVNGHTHSD